MSFTRKHVPVIFNYKINNIILERCTNYKDLGINFDTKLSFTYHINEMVRSASKLLGFFFRNWRGFENISVVKLLYVSFIRSKLEYGSLIWFPIYQNSIVQIESIQRRCVKYMFYKTNGFYPEQGADNNVLLNMFNLNSLKTRRDCAAVGFIYNLINYNIDCPFLLNKVNFLVPRLESRQNNTFLCNTVRTNVMTKSPICNMCNIFNNISRLCDIHCDSLGKILNILYSSQT